MKVLRFRGNSPRDVVPATGVREFRVMPGEEFETDDDTAASLLMQPRHFEEAAPVRVSKAKKDEVAEGDEMKGDR